ncbi:MAG: HEAT repeat domain-containing protein [Chloroflexi bacterium]|nr:HEAT repeat domain-containing protein [Chloroflexota bacterium]
MLAVWMAWLAVSVTHDWLTAESRFYAGLDAELLKLRQRGEQRISLSVTERVRYLALLRGPDQLSRWQAAADLARWRDNTFVPALVAAMQDDTGTRRTCLMAQSLGTMGDSNAVPALLEAIHHRRNLDLRVCATHALAEIGDARAITPLIAKAENLKLREDDRVSAILALGDLALPAAEPALRRIAASDPDERFRAVATAALRQIELTQTNDPVPALAETLNSPAHWVRRAWLIQKLAEHWEARAATALNRFVCRTDAWTSDRIQATALLLHRNAMEEEVTRVLAASGRKEDRWLAKYVQAMEMDRQNAEALARSDLINRSTLSSLSP